MFFVCHVMAVTDLQVCCPVPSSDIEQDQWFTVESTSPEDRMGFLAGFYFRQRCLPHSCSQQNKLDTVLSTQQLGQIISSAYAAGTLTSSSDNHNNNNNHNNINSDSNTNSSTQYVCVTSTTTPGFILLFTKSIIRELVIAGLLVALVFIVSISKMSLTQLAEVSLAEFIPVFKEGLHASRNGAVVRRKIALSRNARIEHH